MLLRKLQHRHQSSKRMTEGIPSLSDFPIDVAVTGNHSVSGVTATC